MKHLRATSKSGMAAKLARYCGGDVSRVKKGMPSRDGAKGYATGGMVSDDDGDEFDGMAAKKSMSKPSRMKGKDKGKDKGTNVNVIVMPKADAPAMPMPPPPGPMAGPPPPPPGPPGPPMPMRARGGRVHEDAAQDKKMVAGMIHKHETNKHTGSPTKFKKGGGILKGDGAGGGLGRLAKARAYGSRPGKG